MLETPELIQNPQLEGEPFFWEAGPVGVLLIHGLTATTAEVRLLARRLHELGYTVAGPLLAGHGRQPGDLNRVHWQDWVEQAESGYQELSTRCRRVYVGGESTGGLLAFYLAAQYPEAAGVLAYAPALRLTGTPVTRLLMRLLAPFRPWVPKKHLDFSMPWQGYRVYPLKGALQLLALQKVTLPRLPKVRQPVLVIQGRLDTAVHPSVPDLILSRVASGYVEKHWLEHSSHCLILDCELDHVTEITVHFIQKTSL